MHFHSGDVSGVLYLKVPQLDREDEELQKKFGFTPDAVVAAAKEEIAKAK